MSVTYDIRQVTRYVLTRSLITNQGAGVADLAEFKRRDDAERVMGTLRAALHPADVTAKNAAIRVGDYAIAMVGVVDNKDTLQALELLESRVANAKRLWQHRENERRSKLQNEIQAEANCLNGLIGRGF